MPATDQTCAVTACSATSKAENSPPCRNKRKRRGQMRGDSGGSSEKEHTQNTHTHTHTPHTHNTHTPHTHTHNTHTHTHTQHTTHTHTHTPHRHTDNTHTPHTHTTHTTQTRTNTHRQTDTHNTCACFVSCSNSPPYPGCKDKTAPRESDMFSIPYQLYFARQSRTWHHGGICFVDHRGTLDNEEEHTVSRMYDISLDQFNDIVRLFFAQLNACSEGERGGVGKERGGGRETARSACGAPPRPAVLTRFNALLCVALLVGWLVAGFAREQNANGHGAHHIPL